MNYQFDSMVRLASGTIELSNVGMVKALGRWVPLHRYCIGIGYCSHFWLLNIPGLDLRFLEIYVTSKFPQMWKQILCTPPPPWLYSSKVVQSQNSNLYRTNIDISVQLQFEHWNTRPTKQRENSNIYFRNLKFKKIQKYNIF